MKFLYLFPAKTKESIKQNSSQIKRVLSNIFFDTTSRSRGNKLVQLILWKQILQNYFIIGCVSTGIYR